VTSFDVPGAGVGRGQGTHPQGIAAGRRVTGVSIGAANVFHGFVRTGVGTVTVFDVPGAGTGSQQGTVGFSINRAGAIAGYFLDANGLRHGFVRFP
jgi:hypothetical protein